MRATWLIGLLALGSCSSDADSTVAPAGSPEDAGAVIEPSPDAAVGAAVPYPTDGWALHTPEQHGMDGSVLQGAFDYAFQDGKNTHGVVVIRGGAIVAEQYEGGRDESSFATSWSMAKSFASALIGIAIGEGLIDGVDVSLAEYYPAWTGTEKEAITIEDILNMASGLDWIETYDPNSPTGADSNMIELAVFQPDQLAYVTDLPVAGPPGQAFHYSSGDTMLLSGILEQATGTSAEAYGREKIFDPLGMGPVDWWRDTAGHTLTYCCIDTPTRQFAKFGLLFLHEGSWDGEQVVPEEWVAASVAPSDPWEGYGYKWWLIGNTEPGVPADTFAARGLDGQYIYVVPSLDLVVVRNGHYDKQAGDALADPNLFGAIPSMGLVDSRGTIPPDEWTDGDFLGPVVDAIVD